MTPEKAVELLANAVAKKGDAHVDHTNAYFDELNQPSCIIGHVLSEIGYGRFELSRGVSSLLQYHSSSGGRILDNAQERNDTGMAWGDILIAAKEELGALSES